MRALVYFSKRPLAKLCFNTSLETPGYRLHNFESALTSSLFTRSYTSSGCNPLLPLALGVKPGLFGKSIGGPRGCGLNDVVEVILKRSHTRGEPTFSETIELGGRRAVCCCIAVESPNRSFVLGLLGVQPIVR